VRIVLVAAICVATPAAADPPTSPITDSSYSIELYDGVAIGNVAVVGMGGATVALAIGTSGTLFNPSAPAVKPTTDTDTWSWDYHLDYLVGTLSTDYDNNGFTSTNGGTSMITGGAGARIGEWGVALTLTGLSAPVAAETMLPSGRTVPLTATTLRGQVALARWVNRIDTAIGVSLTSGLFTFSPDCADAECQDLFDVGGNGLELGATWVPRMENFRIGAAVSGAISGGNLSGCDPADCAGWILPEKVVLPPRLATGVAYRWSRSAWNQLVGGHFRDEKSVTVAADLVITGPSENAYGLESFGNHMLQRAGRHTSVSLRGGAEYEWVPGRLRVRGGSYWEPGRYVGVPGRLHVTFGLEVRVLQFMFWDKPRRGRISLTSDIAERYRNGGLSIGFWH
jgi:hypothetical protein